MNGDQPAFPLTFIDREGCTGMTYRQWLAGMALQGILCANERVPKSVTSWNEFQKILGQSAWGCADALIAAENEGAKTK